MTTDNNDHLWATVATSERRRPPLDHGHHLGNDNRRQRPHCRCHSLSLTNVRRGFFFVRFSRDGRHLTTTTPTHSQTRVGGGSLFVSPHRHHPPSLANASWGWFLVYFSRDGCHTSRPPLGDNQHHQPPPSPQERAGGVVFVCTAPPTPPSPQERAGGVFLCFYGTTNPLPRPKSEGGWLSLFTCT